MRAWRDCKERSLTVSKKAPNVSKEASPEKKSMCLNSWEIMPKKVAHITFLRGILGSRKGSQTGHFGHKNISSLPEQNAERVSRISPGAKPEVSKVSKRSGESSRVCLWGWVCLNWLGGSFGPPPCRNLGGKAHTPKLFALVTIRLTPGQPTGSTDKKRVYVFCSEPRKLTTFS